MPTLLLQNTTLVMALCWMCSWHADEEIDRWTANLWQKPKAGSISRQFFRDLLKKTDPAGVKPGRHFH